MSDPRDPAAGATYTEWWLATLGRTVVWARLRVREAGTAEVFDSDGNVLSYESEDSARAALLDDAHAVGRLDDVHTVVRHDHAHAAAACALHGCHHASLAHES